MTTLKDLLTTIGSLLGELLSLAHDYTEKTPYRRQRLYTRILNRAANQYLQDDRVKPAIALLQKALEIQSATFGEHHPETARTLITLARAQLRLCQFREALTTIERVLDIQRTHRRDAHPDRATAHSLLSEIYQGMGDYTSALAQQQQVSEILHAALGETHPEYTGSLSDLGTLYAQVGNYRDALALLEEALDAHRQTIGEEHLLYAYGLDSLAAVYMSINNYARATPLLSQALRIQLGLPGPDPSRFARTLSHTARMYIRRGMTFLVDPLVQQALEIQRWNVGESHPLYAAALTDAAALHAARNNHAEAVQLLRQALEILRGTLGDLHPTYAETLTELGEAYYGLGNHEAALPLLQQALEIQRRTFGGGHPACASTLELIAELYLVLQRPEDTLRSLRDVVAMYDVLIAQICSIGSEWQRTAYLERALTHVWKYLSCVCAHFASDARVVQDAFELVQKRKGLGNDILAAQRNTLAYGTDQELARKVGELYRLQNRIAYELVTGPDPDEAPDHLRLLVSMNAERERVEALLAREIPLAGLNQLIPESVGVDIATALPTGSVLIEFYHCIEFHAMDPQTRQASVSPHYIAFVLSAGSTGCRAIVDIGEAKVVDRHVSDYVRSLTHTAPDTDRRGLQTESEDSRGPVLHGGIELTTLLFDPLKPYLGDSTRLFVSPVGELARLPFEVLPATEGVFLIDRYEFSYVSVGRNLLRFSIGPALEPAQPVVMADPDYDFDAGQPQVDDQGDTRGEPFRRVPVAPTLCFEPLTGSRLEALEIGQRLGVTPMLGVDVVEATVKAVHRPQILHIATHGLFLSQLDAAFQTRLDYAEVFNVVLSPALVLAGIHTVLAGGQSAVDVEDAMLTPADIAVLNLRGTELVVLSACETGLGRPHAGEGVFGFARAFEVAGAQTVITSLWRVPDQQTKELMIEFYNRILEGEGRAEALHNAQRAIKETYADPFVWGAFVCYGNPDALSLELLQNGLSTSLGPM